MHLTRAHGHVKPVYNSGCAPALRALSWLDASRQMTLATTTGHLALLYRISQTLNSSLNLDEVLDSVMDEVIAATHAERGFLVLRGAEGSLDFRAARGLDHSRIEAPEFQI